MDLFPKESHCALFCGTTSCGKTKFVLDLLQTEYLNYFENIVIFCTTIKYNKTYHGRSYVWKDDSIYLVNPGEKLNEWLKFYYDLMQGMDTLFIIDDCSAEKRYC